MDNKITVIEGPPPTFETIPDLWVHGLSEGLGQTDMVLTRLRTFNGPELVERCYRTWCEKQTMHLEYRTPEGLEASTPIVAARHMETDAGDMILLWLRIADEEVELELGYDDDFSDMDDGDWPPDDLA
jgi:hypothetical protein